MKVTDQKIPRKYSTPAGVRCIVPLIKEEPKKGKDDDKVIKFKLRTNPTDNDSTEFQFPIKTFKAGKTEEYLEWKDDLDKVNYGLNNTTGPAKFSLARRLLQGDAATAFEAEASGKTETNDNFKLCMKAVTDHVLPNRAVFYHKRFMRRHIRKPSDMKSRQFFARMHELNGLIQKMDDEADPLDKDELQEIFEFAMPTKWRTELTKRMIVPSDITHDKLEILETYEALEHADDEEQNSSHKKNPPSQKRRARVDDDNSDRPTKRPKRHCKLHGWCAHSTKECRDIDKEYDNKSDKKRNKKNNGHKSGHGLSLKEHYALIQHAVDNAVNKKKNKKRKQKAIGEFCAQMDKLNLNYDGSDSDNEFSVGEVEDDDEKASSSASEDDV